MRLNIVNNTSHADAPVREMYDLVGVQIYHLCNHWHGARSVVDDLIVQGFYLDLVDDLPETPGALGYHDIDSKGRPFSKVAVNPSLDNGSDWLTGRYSVVSVVGHEALETIGNPLVNMWRDIDAQTETPQELADAVEDTGYSHLGADLTNFLLPSWFNPWGKPPFDYLGQLSAPFTMTAGGYMIVRSGGQEDAIYGADHPAWRKGTHTRAALVGVDA